MQGLDSAARYGPVAGGGFCNGALAWGTKGARSGKRVETGKGTMGRDRKFGAGYGGGPALLEVDLPGAQPARMELPALGRARHTSVRKRRVRRESRGPATNRWRC